MSKVTVTCPHCGRKNSIHENYIKTDIKIYTCYCGKDFKVIEEYKNAVVLEYKAVPH